MNTLEEAANRVRSQVLRARHRNQAAKLASLRRLAAEAMARSPALDASVYLIGSWATGAFDGASDTDLLVIAASASVAMEAQQRLMEIADDVVAMTDSQWHRRLQSRQPFVCHVARQRQQLVGRDEPLDG